MEPRLGRQPELRFPLIRKSTWFRTLALCQSPEQLRKLMALIPLWRDTGNKFDPEFSEAFIRRSIYVNKPGIAVELFNNYAKYNVELTLRGARELLNASYDTRPLSFIISITSLYDVYKLPPVAEDFPSCAMVVAACLKNKTEHGQVIGNALLPHLRTLAQQQCPVPMPKGQEVGWKLPLVYLGRAMKRIEGRLPEDEKGQDVKRDRVRLLIVILNFTPDTKLGSLATTFMVGAVPAAP
ncbi:hypothetical protein AN958_01636 [Leucoagaricus sp. SymC.cos]|nr:hypothetical protein AN958_01636 [Leucoagaricus sp. SymC.cos]